jgi:hypothetical protein
LAVQPNFFDLAEGGRRLFVHVQLLTPGLNIVQDLLDGHGQSVEPDLGLHQFDPVGQC